MEHASVKVVVWNRKNKLLNEQTLYNGLTYEEVMNGHSKIRNKGIANIFSQMGLIEAWGSGIKRILNAAEKYGLPKPRIQEFDNMFRVELFRKNSLTKRERIDFIDELELGRRRDGESSEKGRRRIAILN